VIAGALLVMPGVLFGYFLPALGFVAIAVGLWKRIRSGRLSDEVIAEMQRREK